MALNPQYTGALDDVTAKAIGTVISRNWSDQIMRVNPLLTMIMQGGNNFNKSALNRDGASDSAYVLHNLSFWAGSEISAATLGVGRADMIPTAFPTYIKPDNKTKAKFQVVFMEKATAHSPFEMDALQSGRDENTVDRDIQLVVNRFLTAMDDMMMSSVGGDTKRLQGLYHALATSNTVGGIDQSAQSAWRANVVNLGGALTLLALSKMVNIANFIHDGTSSQGKPDLGLCTVASGGVDTFAALEALIQPIQRLTSAKMAEVGYSTIVHRDVTYVPVNKGTAGTVAHVNSKNWFFDGDKNPKTRMGPILGSMSQETVLSAMAVFSVNRLNNQSLLTGVTG